MNRIFKTIFSKVRGTYVVTGENARSHGKTKSMKAAVTVALLAGAMVAGPVGAADISLDKGTYDSSQVNKAIDDLGIYPGTAGAITNEATVKVNDGVTLDNVEIQKRYRADPAIRIGCLTVQQNATVQIVGGKFHDNYGYDQSAIFDVLDGAKVTISGAEFKNNYQIKSNQALYIGDHGHGGAINNGGNLTISNTNFETNGAEGFGGALYNSESGVLTLKEGNSFTKNGYSNTYNVPTTIIDGFVVYGETKTASNSRGGAIFNKGTLIDLGSEYSENKADSTGGAIYNYGGSAKALISGSNFANNSARRGGAIQNANKAVMSIRNASFSNNSAGQNGGAILNWIEKSLLEAYPEGNGAPSLTIGDDGSKTTFTSNSTKGLGGAIHNGESAMLTIGGTSTFTSNTDSTGTNDIYNDGILQFGGEATVVNEDGTTSTKSITNTKAYIGSGISGGGSMALNSGELEIAENIHVNQGTATFKAGTTTTVSINSSYMVKDGIASTYSEVDEGLLTTAKTQKNGNGGYAIGTANGLTVENGAKLQVTGAQAGKTYLIAYDKSGSVTTGDDGWKGDNLTVTGTSKLLDLKRVGQDAENGTVIISAEEKAPDPKPGPDPDPKPSVLPCVDAPNNLHGLVRDGLIDTDSSKAGVKFLSRATDTRYMPSDSDTIRTINSAVQIGNLGGVKDMTFSGSSMFQRSIENHLSLSRTLQLDKQDVKLHEKGHSDLWVDVIGQHTRRTGINGSCHGKSCDGGNSDGHGLRTDMGGIIVGLDRTSEDGNKHWGIAGMVGTGEAGSTGHLNHTKNDIDFWGLSVYGGIDKDNWNLMGNIAYSSFDSDVEQNLSSSLGMGNKLKADISSHLWSVGGKAEYRFDLGESFAVKPHVGLRWDRMTTSGFSTKAKGQTVFKTKRDTQDIYSLPIGVSAEAGFKTESGWVVRPQGDVALVFATGDLKDTTRFSATGVDAYDTIRTQIVDSTSITASVGVDMQKGNKSFGLHYDAVSSSNQMWQGFMAKFVYKFE